MGQLSETARLDQELEQARDDLRETLQQVNHKVEEVEDRLRPGVILSHHPLALPLAAGVLGFLVGSDRKGQPLRWVAIGALLGAALAATPQGGNHGTNTTSK
jgi:hypothetical protein